MHATFVNIGQLEWDVLGEAFDLEEMTVVGLGSSPSLEPAPNHYFGTLSFIEQDRENSAQLFSSYLSSFDSKLMQPWIPRSLKMLDRFDTRGQLSFPIRIEIFNRVAGFWLRRFREQRPDFVYFSSPPHEFGDFLVYAVAAELGIPSYFWHDYYPLKSKILSKDLVAPWEPLPGFKSLPLRKPSRVDVESCTRIAHSHPGDEEQLPPYVSESLKRIGRQATLASKLKRIVFYIQASVQILLRGFGVSAPGNVPVASKFLRTYAGFLGSFGKVVDSMNVARTRELLLKGPESIDQTSPFGLFYLHYEPEMTVNPLGDVLMQAEAVSSVASALPAGWKLYVKEHPAQTDRASAGFFTGRSEAFYHSLSSIPNVFLLNDQILARALFDEAQFVSTISGSVGFEALLRGIPVISFGSSWYTDFPGVFRPSAQDELSEWFARDGFLKRPQIGDVIKAVDSAAGSCCIISFNETECRALGAEWDPVIFKGNLRLALDLIKPG